MRLNSKELWNKESSITYAANCDLRESSSTEENASFLVRWATELFGSWSQWMKHTLPGCRVNLKQSTLRIAHKIQEMYD